MSYLIAKDLEDAIRLRERYPAFFLLVGGSDAVLKSDKIDGIIDITHLDELSYIRKDKNSIKIGALTTINTILNNESIKQYLPILSEASKEFASYQIRNIASMAGNIVNDSPVADLIAPLLVLDAKVTLLSSKNKRTIPLKELFIGFKKLNMENEIIVSFSIEIKEHQYYYKKVGARAKLNISKLSLAMVKNRDGFFISGTSLNPFVSRFCHLEELFNSGNFDDNLIKEAMEMDISPSGSYRSTKEYRRAVLFNLLKDALKSFRV